MARPKLTVRQLANDTGLSNDEVLITLWDNHIEVANQHSIIPKGETNKARRVVGIATRRELSTASYWQGLFKLNDSDFADLFEKLGIPQSATQRRLSKKTINKLRSESHVRQIPIGNESLPTPLPPTRSAPFKLQIIGKPKDLKHLDAETIEAIHLQLVADFAEHHDPIDPPGVRSGGYLESAVTRPQTSYGEVKKYPSAEMAASALMHSLVHNHPFHNGNKRTALVSLLVFLDNNGLMMTCSDEELFRYVLRIAQHSIVSPPTTDNLPDREVSEIARWIKRRTRVIEGGERTIPFRRLRRILSRQGCAVFIKGSSATINRTRERKGIFRTRNEDLSTTIAYYDEGREVDKGTITKIRRELKLDNMNGIDSASFYDNAPAAADEFIAKYRTILRRLAQL